MCWVILLLRLARLRSVKKSLSRLRVKTTLKTLPRN
ncbi:Uncharacterised protein [Vibrio cholerae]|nr:Uncharacterised protein [Vibrio cholerae]